jgi:hypothetical protein
VDIEPKWGIARHEFGEMRHDDPAQNGFASAQSDSLGAGVGSIHHVVECAEESVCGQGHSSASFIRLQGLANPIKQWCAEGLLQLLQLPTELALPVWVRAGGGDNRPCFNHRAQCLKTVNRDPG